MQQVCADGVLNFPFWRTAGFGPLSPRCRNFKVVQTAEHAEEGLVPAPSLLSWQLYKQDGGLKLEIQ